MMNREQQLERLNGFVETLEVADSYSDLAKNVLAIVKDESVGTLDDFLNNVCTYGCVSGYVGSLVYYNQTDKFFKDNMDDIFTLYNQLKEEFGCDPLGDKEINANILAWLAFEELCRQFINELESEEE